MKNKNNEELKNENEYVHKKEIQSFIIKELVNLKIIKPVQDSFYATKNLLKNITRLDRAIQNYEKEIKRLQKAKNKIDSPKFKTSNIESNFELPTNNLDVINNRIIDLYQSITKIKEYKKSVEEIINGLSDTEKRLIKLFYYEKKNMNDISLLLNYDTSTCYRKLDDAINHIKIELFPGLFIDSLLA